MSSVDLVGLDHGALAASCKQEVVFIEGSGSAGAHTSNCVFIVWPIFGLKDPHLSCSCDASPLFWVNEAIARNSRKKNKAALLTSFKNLKGPLRGEGFCLLT